MELTPQEIRVLGCLVEKQLTTPQAYPLTESALVAACNQTTNRDPVVTYDQTTVRRTLLNLRQQGLARMVHRPGDRVEKHRHLLDEALELTPAQVALLGVLFLRGPQTVGELRTRTERLHPFSSLSEVEEVLAELSAREPQPLVRRLERQPGQKEARYGHCLGDDQAGEPPAEQPPRIDGGEDATPRVTAPVGDALTELRAEVAALRQRVEQLEAALRSGEGQAAEDGGRD